jgi:hypothetical protein
MVRRVVSLVVACAVAGTVFGMPGVSFAEDKKVEAAAKVLQKKAMGDDYLATEFGKAKDKLDKAITQCGTDKCSANLRALLRRDLGTVLIVGGLDKDKGAQAFAEAAKLDNSIQLDADYKTKDTEAAWEKRLALPMAILKATSPIRPLPNKRFEPPFRYMQNTTEPTSSRA